MYCACKNSTERALSSHRSHAETQHEVYTLYYKKIATKPANSNLSAISEYSGEFIFYL